VPTTGTVKWYSDEKKFGFVKPDDAHPGERDVFVHISSLEEAGIRTLVEGQRISYEVRPDRRYPDRLNVYQIELLD
jgi:CspA family cold shock protein